MMQTRVNNLISKVQAILNSSRDLNDDKKRQLKEGCYCLKSHDLVGLDLIILSLSEDKTKETNNSKYKSIIELAKSIREDFMSNVIPLTKAEQLFLNLGYNRFFDLYEEISTMTFWEKESSYRFQRISQVFAVYTEILNYKPFESILKWMSKYRPPMEAEISGDLFKMIRNILAHFPFFDKWNDVWISKELINWHKENQSIDRFFKKFCGKKKVKYRYKITGKEGFEYLSICLPVVYDDGKIYLKDIVSEKQGIQFSLAMMLRVLNTQIDEIKV